MDCVFKYMCSMDTCVILLFIYRQFDQICVFIMKHLRTVAAKVVVNRAYSILFYVVYGPKLQAESLRTEFWTENYLSFSRLLVNAWLAMCYSSHSTHHFLLFKNLSSQAVSSCQ